MHCLRQQLSTAEPATQPAVAGTLRSPVDAAIRRAPGRTPEAEVMTVSWRAPFATRPNAGTASIARDALTRDAASAFGAVPTTCGGSARESADGVRCDALSARRARAGRSRPLAWVIAVLLALATPAHAQWIAPGDQLRLNYGPKAVHFNPSDDHAEWNHLVAVEWVTPRWTWFGADRAVAGLGLLDNSFAQFSQYLYVGQEWDVARVAGGTLGLSVTAGLLHGYKDEHRDKIPFNSLGVAPVIIPAASWRYGSFGVWTTLLGANGLLFGVSWTIALD